jgi:formylglycine-generating enzyme required for sulfatase activity
MIICLMTMVSCAIGTAEAAPIDPMVIAWVSVTDPGFSGRISKYETTNAQYCQFLNAALASGDIAIFTTDHGLVKSVNGASGSNNGEDFVGQPYYLLIGEGDAGGGDPIVGGAARINYTGSLFTIDSGFENHPVTYVSWYGANAFCNYYGYRLPAESEWQAVADYSGSYMYGCGAAINNNTANYFGSTHPYGTTVVGAFGTYGYGMCDMAGNVWEWTSSCYYPLSDCGNQPRVIRGGGWYYPDTTCAISFRGNSSKEDTACVIGFRVVTSQPATPPIANAGPDQTVADSDDNGTEQITLDGSASSDSDGTIVSWGWTDSLGASIPDGETTTVALSVGTHTITLTVTDNDVLTGADTVTVTVEPYPNQPPVADADGPYTIFVGDMLTLDASGSTDHDNDIISYLWDLNDDGVFETDAGSEAVVSVDYAHLQSIGLLVDNTYTIRAKVTDSVGQSHVAATTLTILPIPALPVVVDIKPGSCPNPLNVKSSGVLPVAILGAAGFDVFAIDPTSIRLAGVRPLRSSYDDVAAPVSDANDCACTEHGPDGFLDLSLKFKTQEIVTAIGDVNDGQVLALQLTGVLFDERPIEGSDCVVILGRHKPFNKADFNRDGKVDWADYAAFAENWLQSTVVEE